MDPTSLSDAAAVDFDELEVGLEFETPTVTVTAADVDTFARLTGDHHPLHLDEEFASASVFGERIAHGMLVLSIALGLMPLDPDRIAALRRVSDATFKAPVRLGDTIRVRCRIAAVRPLDERFGVVTYAWKVLNQADRVVIRANVESLWHRSAA